MAHRVCNAGFIFILYNGPLNTTEGQYHSVKMIKTEGNSAKIGFSLLEWEIAISPTSQDILWKCLILQEI